MSLVEERFSVFAAPIDCHVEVSVRDEKVASVRLTRAPKPDTPVSSGAARIRDAISRHFNTGTEDLSRIPVDLSTMPPFWRAVLETLRNVPAGETVTYGQLAVLAGRPGASRAVGGAMAHNPIALIVPCHRVVASGGKLGNYSGEGSTETKRRLLALEGARGYASAAGAPFRT